MLKGLLRRAQEAANKHLPEGVRDSGRRLADAVLEHAPRIVQDTVGPLLRPDPDAAAAAPAGSAEPSATTGSSPAAGAEDSLDFRDTQKRVVLFGYPEDDSTNRVAAMFTAAGVTFRRQNLHQQPREALQIASMTGVMVPPYVYIHGRFWGGEGEMESLIALGELQFVIDNQLDRLSDEARRIGKLRESFDDALTPDNIVFRLGRGHILSIDGLDCWYEPGPTPRFFYDGGPLPVEDMPRVAAEIARRAESPDTTTRWLFEPSVGV
jgi:glutaredoxin